MKYISIPRKIWFYRTVQKTSRVFKLSPQCRTLSADAKQRMRRAVLSREDCKVLESISRPKWTPKLTEDKTVTSVQKISPCILQFNESSSSHPKNFTSMRVTLQATARFPPLRATDAIKRSYLWNQRMDALKSREKDLGKIALTLNNDPSLSAEATNMKGLVAFTKQDTEAFKDINSITKGTSKINQAKTTEPIGKNKPCILQFNRPTSDQTKRYMSSRNTFQGQPRGFPQLRGADEIQRSYMKRQFMNVERSRGKETAKAEPLTPDNDPTKQGKWR